MEHKKIYRAGVIPYYVNDGEIYMMFMVPSNTQHGGGKPQMAKGKIEEGEDEITAALREGSEELGLFAGNIVGDIESLGEWLGRTTVYVMEINDINMFGEPLEETDEVMWLTCKQFCNIGRGLHKPVVQAALRAISKKH